MREYERERDIILLYVLYLCTLMVIRPVILVIDVSTFRDAQKLGLSYNRWEIRAAFPWGKPATIVRRYPAGIEG